jgi:RNA polymerase sigma-70 factor (ECF subfamily)
VADAAGSPEERAITVELEAVAVATLGQLRPEDRETLRIAIFGEGQRDAPPATFRKRVERALGRLRAAWRDHGIG